jgi:hypothetical protein
MTCLRLEVHDSHRPENQGLFLGAFACRIIASREITVGKHDANTADPNTRNGMSWQVYVLLGGMGLGVLILIAHALGLI